LRAEHVEQFEVDINVASGAVFSVCVSGPGAVHLSGYFNRLLYQESDSNEESYSYSDSDSKMIYLVRLNCGIIWKEDLQNLLLVKTIKKKGMWKLCLQVQIWMKNKEVQRAQSSPKTSSKFKQTTSSLKLPHLHRKERLEKIRLIHLNKNKHLHFPHLTVHKNNHRHKNLKAPLVNNRKLQRLKQHLRKFNLSKHQNRHRARIQQRRKRKRRKVLVLSQAHPGVNLRPLRLPPHQRQLEFRLPSLALLAVNQLLLAHLEGKTRKRIHKRANSRLLLSSKIRKRLEKREKDLFLVVQNRKNIRRINKGILFR